MEKITIASNFEAEAIKVVKAILSKGEDNGFLNPKHFPNVRVMISDEEPKEYVILTKITPPEDLKELLESKSIYIVMELEREKYILPKRKVIPLAGLIRKKYEELIKEKREKNEKNANPI